MEIEQMIALAEELAAAKSKQDVKAALKVLHPTMVLETPAFGSRIVGLEENEKALSNFFTNFPDYNVELSGYAGHGNTLACWGIVGMTMTGDRFGVSPGGSRAVLPVFIKFTFKDSLIASEQFFFDLSELCAQSGVSTDQVRRNIHKKAAGVGFNWI